MSRRHQISASLLYNWRSAWKAAAVAARTPATLFMPLGVFAGAGSERAAMLAVPPAEPSQQPQINGGGAGGIEIALPNGARVCVDAFVNEQALSLVLRAMKGTT